MNKIAIVGAGELGKQVLEIVNTEGKYITVGFFDDSLSSNKAHGLTILGSTDTILEQFSLNKFDGLIFAIGYKHLDKKQAFLEQFSSIPFYSTIHPSAVIEPTAIIDKGVIVYANCYVGHRCKLKNGSIVNVGCNIPHDNIIKSCSFLSVGVQMGGGTTIGSCTFIGVGATISDGLQLTNNVTIGAGSVVIKDINESGTYIGVPAKRLNK